eukprot:SAG11_NODE_32470_length_283_cov_0.847826_1_plen_59_part_00
MRSPRRQVIVEADRAAAAAEEGYTVWLGTLEPAAASPMNDVLLGEVAGGALSWGLALS